MYADKISEAMTKAINETARRRQIQERHNEEYHITPRTIQKEIRELISNEVENKVQKKEKLSKKEKNDIMIEIEEEMKLAAKNLDFERAMELRDILFEMKGNN